jgi:hypothetical protein
VAGTSKAKASVAEASKKVASVAVRNVLVVVVASKRNGEPSYSFTKGFSGNLCEVWRMKCCLIHLLTTV